MTAKRIFLPICGAAKPTPSVASMVLIRPEIRRFNSRGLMVLKSSSVDFFLKTGLGTVIILKIGIKLVLSIMY